MTLQQVLVTLQRAQEQVLELALEQVRVLGLAAAQVQELAQAEAAGLARLALVEAEAQVEVLEPQEQE